MEKFSFCDFVFELQVDFVGAPVHVGLTNWGHVDEDG